MWDRDGNLIRYNASESSCSRRVHDSPPSRLKRLVRSVLMRLTPYEPREMEEPFTLIIPKDYHDFAHEGIKIIREAGLEHKMSPRFRAYMAQHIQTEAIWAEADRKREAQSQLARQAMARLTKEEIEAIRREQ